MLKKSKICLLLGIIVILLWCLLRKITRKEGFDLFDNTFTSLGKKAWHKAGEARDYVDNNTAYIFNAEDGDMYPNIGDAANMRDQAADVAYLETILKPSLIDTIKMKTFNPAVFSNDRSIYVADPQVTGMNRSRLGVANYSLADITTDILNNNPQQAIDWDKVYVDTNITKDNTISALRLPNTKSNIIVDACSKKGFLNSSFKEDICTAYAGNQQAINEKCQELTADNCKIPSCCVLVNGNTCMAGNMQGPNFLSQSGQDVDYTYYYYKDKCYGTGCDMAKQYESACNVYANNDTGISKNCMLQMFNINGCPNSNPTELINDNMVQAYSQSSKQYVNNYIRTSIGILKYNIENNDDPTASKNLCYGDITPKAKPISSKKKGEKLGREGEPAPAENLNDVGNAINSSIDRLF